MARSGAPRSWHTQHCYIIQLSQIWIRPLGERMNANERHSFKVAHLFTRGASLCQDKMQAGCHTHTHTYTHSQHHSACTASETRFAPRLHPNQSPGLLRWWLTQTPVMLVLNARARHAPLSWANPQPGRTTALGYFGPQSLCSLSMGRRVQDTEEAPWQLSKKTWEWGRARFRNKPWTPAKRCELYGCQFKCIHRAKLF